MISYPWAVGTVLTMIMVPVFYSTLYKIRSPAK